ncbi:hypothetical protein BX666DRAFT_401699 [Dichotomocladium elegans]|nr:hypothetical protein BX666DRAFT_401699 [Dichotomocladium elegans]
MLQERDIEIDAIKKDLESLRTVNTELEDRSKKYVNVLSKTKKQILKLEKEKADALEQSTTVRAQWKDTVSEVKKLEEEVNRLKGSLQSAESETMILQKDRQQVVEEKNRIFEQLQIKQAEFEGSQSLAENLRLQLKECEHQIEEANERISANDDYQGLVESTKQELDTLKAQYSKEKRDWQRELEQCQIDLQNFKQDKESSWAQVQDLQAELESFQGQILDMQKALDAKIKEVESAHFDISDHVIRIRRLETELENSRQEAQTSQNMIVRMVSFRESYILMSRYSKSLSTRSQLWKLLMVNKSMNWKMLASVKGI